MSWCEAVVVGRRDGSPHLNSTERLINLSNDPSDGFEFVKQIAIYHRYFVHDENSSVLPSSNSALIVLKPFLQQSFDIFLSKPNSCGVTNP